MRSPSIDAWLVSVKILSSSSNIATNMMMRNLVRQQARSVDALFGNKTARCPDRSSETWRMSVAMQSHRVEDRRSSRLGLELSQTVTGHISQLSRNTLVDLSSDEVGVISFAPLPSYSLSEAF